MLNRMQNGVVLTQGPFKELDYEMASNASPLIFDLKFSVEISSLICVFFFSYSVNKPDLLNNYVACQFCSIKRRKLRKLRKNKKNA